MEWVRGQWATYVTTGEVPSLEHELRNDTVELGALVPKPFLPRAKGTEVRDGPGHDIVVEVEVDPTRLHYHRISQCRQYHQGIQSAQQR